MSLRLPATLPSGDRGLWRAQAVPSGQPVELIEVLIDEVGAEAWLRFRFLAPQIGEGEAALNFEQAQADFEHLCREIALPYLEAYDLQADVAVISLLDRPVEFGVTDADATQFIEAFRIGNNGCEPEGVW